MKTLALTALAALALTSAAHAAPDDDEDEPLRRAPRPRFDFDAISIDGNLVAPEAAAIGATPGGAQDIAHARDLARRGIVPQPEAFTPEGLFSEHDLALPDDGTCRRLLCTATAAADVRLAAQPEVGWLVQLGFTSGLTELRRPPLSIVAVVDRSGSMSGAPIETVRASLHALVDQLGPADQLAIVTYGSSVTDVLPPTRASEPAVRSAIDGIAVDGATNLEAGLERGFAMARQARRSFDGASRVMLFTDEQPNVGATDAGTFMGLARAASEAGVGLTTVGVGVRFGADLAHAVSSVRGGNLFFVSGPEHGREAFADRFDTMVVELAYDLRVELEPEAGLRVAGVYGVPGEGVTWTERGIAIEVETLFATRDRDGAIFLSLAPDDDLTSRPDALGRISLSYEPRDGARSTTREAVRVAGTPPDGLALGALLVDEVTTLRAATAAFHEGRPDEAQALLASLRQRLQGAGAPEGELELVTHLFEAAGGGAHHAPRRDLISGLPR